MSLQSLEDVRKLVEIYRLDTLAQMFKPEKELKIETADEELKQLLEEFLDVTKEFMKRKDSLTTRMGTLEWLDLIQRVLELEAKVIKVVGDKSYAQFDDEKRWFVEFAIEGMVEIIQRVQIWIRKEYGLFKKTRRDHAILRQNVFRELSNLTFSLFSIVFTIIELEKGESKPQELYNIVGESLYITRHLR